MAGVAPKRAKIGQNWREAESEPLEREVPSHQPGENFLLPFAVNCKSEPLMVNGGGEQEKGEVKNFGREFSRCEISLFW